MLSISILVVEDEAPKRLHIERFLQSLNTSMTIESARSVNGALDAIDEFRPDLILLDMSLPTFDVGDREPGGRPQGFGGLEVLRQMALAKCLCPTIVITGYEAFPREMGKPVELAQVRAELEAEFPSVLKGVLHYNSTYDEWKLLLKAILSEFGIEPGG